MSRLSRVLSVAFISLSLPVALSANTSSQASQGKFATPVGSTESAPSVQTSGPIMRLAHGGGRRGSGKHRRGDRLFSELDLSQAQRDQIFQIRHDAVPVMRQYRQAMRQARRDLRAAAFADRYDQARIDQIIVRMTNAKTELARLRAQSDHQIFQILDSTQRARLQLLLEQRRRI